MKKLIIHPGAGKTGTTSIQMSLKDHYKDLLNQRIGYLGMSFENTISDTAPKETNAELFSLRHELGEKIEEDPQRMLEFCSSQIKLYMEENPNVDILVWSNESLVNQHNWIRSLKEKLTELVSIKTIYGIRDPSKWIISAYFQWGNNSDFKEFVRKRSLAGPGEMWAKETNDFRVLDLDSESNIVEAFLTMVNFAPPENFPKYMENTTANKRQLTNEKLLRYSDLLSSDKSLSAWVEREKAGIRDLRRLGSGPLID